MTHLIAQYLFDEGSGTSVLDSSGNNNTGSSVNCTYVEGKTGYGLSFNGASSLVTIPTTPNINTIGAAGISFTISFWFKTLGKGIFAISTKTGGGKTPFAIMCPITPDGYIVSIISNGTSSIVFNTPINIDTADDSWHHIALVRNTTTSLFSLYLDGILSDNISDSLGDCSNTSNIIIGHNSYSGLIDDFKIFNNALTSTEIAQEYAAAQSIIQLQYVINSETYNLTPYVIDFKLEQEVEKFLDKFELQLSRLIDNQDWFTDFLPHNEILLWYKNNKIWGGRVIEREKKDYYNVICYSFSEILGRRHSNDVYENIAPENIFSALINKYTDMTPNTIPSGIVISRYAAFDYVDATIIKLANLLDWQIKSDANKNIYLQPRGHDTNTTKTIYRSSTSGNAVFGRWQRDSKNLANFIMIRGNDTEYSTTETFSGTGADAPIGKAYLDDGGAFTDYTTAANNATANDVNLLPATEVVNDAFYFGMNKTFEYIKINIGTAGVGSGITWEYYNGSEWTTLSVTDNTSQFTVSGTNTITFTLPIDWTTTTINTSNLYWVRARCSTASYTTQPLATQIWLDGSHFLVTERPIGIKVTVDGIEVSREDYIIQSENKRIIFNTAPASGTNNIIINYTYIYPIYIERKDVTSINTYGEFRKYIWAKWAKTFNDAREFATNYLSLYSQPFFSNDIVVPLSWLPDITIGEQIRVKDDIDTVDSYLPIQILTANLVKGNIKLHVGSYIPNIGIWQLQVMDRIKELDKSLVATEILQLNNTESETANIAETLIEGSLNYINLDGTNNQTFNGIVTSGANSSTNNNWIGITWSPELSLFAAVSVSGAGNRVMTSPDGITWTARTSAADNDWRGITWSPELGLFAAVSVTGTGNRVMTSPDGITWTSRTSAADNSWVGITWSSKLQLFLATSNTGTGNRVMTSPNGITWTSRTSAGDYNWSSILWSSKIGKCVCIAYGSSYAMSSSNGIDWTLHSTPSSNGWTSLAESPELGLFAAVSETGTGNRVMTSPDGITWTSRTSAADNSWYSITWSPELGLFAAVAYTGTGNRVMTSPDGITWTTQSSVSDRVWTSIISSASLRKFTAVAYGGGTTTQIMNITFNSSRGSVNDSRFSLSRFV